MDITSFTNDNAKHAFHFQTPLRLSADAFDFTLNSDAVVKFTGQGVWESLPERLPLASRFLSSFEARILPPAIGDP
jgi:hypothetical protein